MKYFAVILLFIIMVFSGCEGGPDRPDNLMAEGNYVNVLTELQLLKAYQPQPDSLTIDSLKTAIYQKYGATEQQFQQSHAYYQQDIDHQDERLKQAIEQLRKDHLLKPDSTSHPDSGRINDPEANLQHINQNEGTQK